MKEKSNRIYYFGDLDYEGIGIYESLAELFQEYWEIVPFCSAYHTMLLKAELMQGLPDTKEKQNRNIQDLFFSYFQLEEQEQMKKILHQEQYIPQEILNITDL